MVVRLVVEIGLPGAPSAVGETDSVSLSALYQLKRGLYTHTLILCLAVNFCAVLSPYLKTWYNQSESTVVSANSLPHILYMYLILLVAPKGLVA